MHTTTGSSLVYEPGAVASVDIFDHDSSIYRSVMRCHNVTETTNASVEDLDAKRLYENVSHVIYGYALPSVCLFGIVGNVLNLCILTRRKLQKSFRTLEQAANLCLISLAVSDLCFCVAAFPSLFLPSDDTYTSKVLLYYRLYCAAVINVFIMVSTWLTVAMSLERYLAICHPLRQDIYLTTRRIKIVIVLTYILSLLFNIPVLWRYEVMLVCTGLEGATSSGVNGSDVITGSLVNATYMPTPVPLLGNSQLDTAYRVMWAVVGNIIPLILLFYFNVCLCRKIYKSYKMRLKFKSRGPEGSHSSHVLTITLVVIVVMFFILVAPSELAIHAGSLYSSESSYSSLTIEAVMNFLQSINFSVNFILYCIISPYFRKTLKYIFCCGCYNIYQVSKQWKKEFETSLM